MNRQKSAEHSEVRMRAGCKINIFLRITGRRADGYHELDTLFLPLAEPHDELVIRTKPTAHAETGLRVHCTTPGIDLTQNTLTCAYEHFASVTGWRPDLDIELVKGIPHGAGLGGGSSDAAALLHYLQAHCPTPLTNEQLHHTALKVGADVPFFLQNAPRLAQGVGEKLGLCPPEWAILRDLFLVLVCPPVCVPTAWAFAAWDTWQAKGPPKDLAEEQARNSTQKKQLFSPPLGGESLTSGDNPAKNHRSCSSGLFSVDVMALLVAENSFEPVVFARFAELGRIKAYLLQEGAAAACMSGSGSALFGLFRQEKTARTAVDFLRKQGFTTYGPCAAMT